MHFDGPSAEHHQPAGGAQTRDGATAPDARPSSAGCTAVPALRVRDVSKRYGDQQALADIELEVRPGETVAIAGLNGAGKTTLLRCLLDFTRADAGRIEVCGVDARIPAARAQLAFLPERFAPPQYLTGHEVLTWLAGLNGRHWTPDQSLAAFERFEVPKAAMRRPVRQLSKGTTQKLGLAAVLASDKPLRVLDEPMSGLDPQARRFVADALAQVRAAGSALLFTSHSMTDIDRLCDRVAVIHAGRVRWFGPPGALKAAHGSADLESAFLACIA